MSEIKDNELKWLGIDFDQTIASNSGAPDFTPLEPLDGAKEALDLLVSKGWKIVIYTARAWHEYDIIENWLNKYNLPFRRIVCGKLFVKWMIDDRNIEFKGNWPEIIERLNHDI